MFRHAWIVGVCDGKVYVDLDIYVVCKYLYMCIYVHMCMCFVFYVYVYVCGMRYVVCVSECICMWYVYLNVYVCGMCISMYMGYHYIYVASSMSVRGMCDFDGWFLY